MQKVSFKKLSILGLVLMAASAVTAAIIPAKSDDNKAPGFTLTFDSGSLPNSELSCEATDEVGSEPCQGATATTNGPSATTSQEGFSSDATE